MPIRPELRHLYRGPGWQAVRARISGAGRQPVRAVRETQRDVRGPAHAMGQGVPGDVVAVGSGFALA